MTCLSLTGAEPNRRRVQFQDASKRPALDSASYHFDVDGYCYHAECDLDLRASVSTIGLLDSSVKCHGDEITIITAVSEVVGFSVPAALKTMRVRILRDGLIIYDEVVGTRACPEQGLCVIDLMAP
jgi:hypothetical protein